MDICPFSGQPCPHKKITHVTELKKDGSVVNLSLCKKCTEQYLDMDPATTIEPKPAPLQKVEDATPPADVGAALGQLFGAFLFGKKPMVQKKRKADKAPCPSCGVTLADIAHTGRIGCPACYSHFGDEMRTVLAHTHGSTQHAGKKPSGWQERKQKEELNLPVEEQIKFLKIKMAQAIEIENYEFAGVLKEKIRKLQEPSNDSAA